MKEKYTAENETCSPCIGTCSTLRGDKICQGCFRTEDEIMLWHTMDDEQKKTIIQRIRKQRHP